MKQTQIYLTLFSLLLTFFIAPIGQAQNSKQAKPVKPLRALLICGGCCHDYDKQHKILSDGIMARANIQVDVWWTDDKSPNPPLTIYDKENWAEGYDVIIHDECAAANKDVEIVKRILNVHEDTPAVHLHCAMHSFRNRTDLWAKHIGLYSLRHGPHLPIDVEIVDKEHPIMEGIDDWRIDKDELYNNEKVHSAHALAVGTQVVNKDRTDTAIVVWTNEKVGAKSFSTSLGHYNEVVASDRYLDLVARGTLWSCDKLNENYLKPFQGKNEITFVKGKAAPKKIASAPKGATVVYPTASSIQNQHHPANAFDGDPDTRWCASDGSYPQWLQFQFKSPQKVNSIKINWEMNKVYRYRIEGSNNGKDWRTLMDCSGNETPSPELTNPIHSIPFKHFRINGLGSKGGWCSIRDVEVIGKGFKKVWPGSKDFKSTVEPTPADPHKKQGNIQPRIEPITPQREAEILKDVKLADGFEATLFAAPPAVNYPVFVAATPDGTLYVSSDGNGSLGRNPGRGRVIRLRDTDGDGRADETKVFCKVDAPRGLLWDHDRLFLMHPPHLSAFIDKDGDGVADEQKILVKNLAFGYDKRPADHTTNGISLGPDGYLYIAGGDFGFMDAEGTDGTRLTHRGGGVIRVRPDGTGLEVYSTGTRNILEVAISPSMEMFARDNTNDGGGWNVRFHHFTGGDDHGYPRLYKNFPEECIAPLADYGGGSGCGAVYLKEPGFGDWNNSPYSADWGTGGIFRHSVKAEGATFVETKKPEPIVRMSRPTDADVDAMSRLYCASWKGATFNWEGPNVGYIIQVKPKGFKPNPLPDFKSATESDLVGLLDSPSYRRQMEAQRELIRRGNSATMLLEKTRSGQTSERTMVQNILESSTDQQIVEALGHPDKVINHVAVRELGKRKLSEDCFAALSNPKRRTNALRALGMIHQVPVVQRLIAMLDSASPDGKLELLATLCRLHFLEGKWDGASWGTRPDTRGPYYQPEPWKGTPLIAEVLQTSLDTLPPKQVLNLIREMNGNRIQNDDALKRIVKLAEQDTDLLGVAVKQIAAQQEVPAFALPTLIRVTQRKQSGEEILTNAARTLSKVNQPQCVDATLHAIARLRAEVPYNANMRQTWITCFGSRALENQVQQLMKIVESGDASKAYWADAAMLMIASRRNSSPEAKQVAIARMQKAWDDEMVRANLIEAASLTGNHILDDKIIDLLSTPEAKNRKIAVAAKRLNLKVREKDNSLKVGQLKIDDAIAKSTNIHGDVGVGERVFTKANCIACHTVRMNEKQKGPYLGNIAQTYPRKELATAILKPNHSIAQGFKTNLIADTDGMMVSGYITEESADRVVMRDNEGKEFVFAKDDIEERKETELSAMPEGLMKDFSVNELASLLDFLQGLAKE